MRGRKLTTFVYDSRMLGCMSEHQLRALHQDCCIRCISARNATTEVLHALIKDRQNVEDELTRRSS